MQQSYNRFFFFPNPEVALVLHHRLEHQAQSYTHMSLHASCKGHEHLYMTLRFVKLKMFKIRHLRSAMSMSLCQIVSLLSRARTSSQQCHNWNRYGFENLWSAHVKAAWMKVFILRIKSAVIQRHQENREQKKPCSLKQASVFVCTFISLAVFYLLVNVSCLCSSHSFLYTKTFTCLSV